MEGTTTTLEVVLGGSKYSDSARGFLVRQIRRASATRRPLVYS